MVYIFLCVDFDRDAAFPALGHKHAVSKPRQAEIQDVLTDPEKSAEIQGSVEGFGQILSFLIQRKLPTSFYFEARTIELISKRHPEFLKRLNKSFFEMGAHGYDHEDLVGEETGIPFEKQEEFNLIKKAKEKIEELFSTKIIGFRAPYMRLSENTQKVLMDLDFVYDSSIYQESDKAIIPYSDEHGLIEFPVIKTPKESLMKGMYTYLWPLFEGKREIKEIVSNYIQLIHNSTEDNSYISINLHSWHFAYNVELNCYLSQKEIRQNTEFLIKLITKLEEVEGVHFSTPKLWLEENELRRKT